MWIGADIPDGALPELQRFDVCFDDVYEQRIEFSIERAGQYRRRVRESVIMQTEPFSLTAPSRDERQWAMICHLSAMLMYVTVIGGFVAPFVIWLLKRDEMPFLADQGKETLNFQITILLALACAGVLMLVLVGFPIFWGLLLFHFIVTLVAAVKVSEGVAFRYPFCWRVIR